MKRKQRLLLKLWDAILIIGYLMFLLCVTILAIIVVVFLITGGMYAISVLLNFYPSKEQLLQYSIPVGLVLIIGIIANKIIKERRG